MKAQEEIGTAGLDGNGTQLLRGDFTRLPAGIRLQQLHTGKAFGHSHGNRFHMFRRNPGNDFQKLSQAACVCMRMAGRPDAMSIRRGVCWFILLRWNIASVWMKRLRNGGIYTLLPFTI